MPDILIVGSGPAGLTAAIYAARARLSATVVEKDYAGSGQIAAAEQVDNYPGLPEISGYDLGEKMRGHAERFGTKFKSGEVSGIKKTENGFSVDLKNGEELEAKAIIYAAGTSYRRLEAEGGRLRGVSYCATCDGAFYENRTVAVVGGGDTALTDALYLAKLAERVFLIHRREKFRANAALTEKVKNTANIELVLNAVPIKILGEKNVNAVELLQNGLTKELKTDGVFVAIGSVPNTDILSGLVELDKNGYIIADESGKTSLGGFFAAGDVRAKTLRQVITACADGANCVDSAEKYLEYL